MTKALEKAHQVKAARQLFELDHAFIGRDGVEKLTKPFGFMGTTRTMKADPPGTFKGLTLWDKDGNPVDEMEGQDATVTAEEICKHLGISYPAMYGRGSQLMVCAKSILEHLMKKAPSPENA